jgi:drug/metabolite transporter (DMT)-like permease
MSAAAAPARDPVLATEALLLVMATIWGANFAVMKYGTQVLDPLAYNGVRMTLATVVLLAIIRGQRAKLPAWRDIRALMLLGVLGHGIYQGFFILGLARTRAGTASLVIASSPGVIAIVGRLLGVEKVSTRAIGGIVLSIAGIAFVIFGSSQSSEGESSVIGDLLILVAVVIWAFYTSLLRPFTQRLDGVQIAGWTLVGGVLPMLLFAAPALARTEWRAVAVLTWGAIAYSGVMAMVVAYVFWYRGVRVIGSTRTAMYGNLQPIVALAVSWPLLGEVPTIWQGVGAAAVMGGLLLTRQPQMAEPAHGE